MLTNCAMKKEYRDFNTKLQHHNSSKNATEMLKKWAGSGGGHYSSHHGKFLHSGWASWILLEPKSAIAPLCCTHPSPYPHLWEKKPQSPSNFENNTHCIWVSQRSTCQEDSKLASELSRVHLEELPQKSNANAASVCLAWVSDSSLCVGDTLGRGLAWICILASFPVVIKYPEQNNLGEKDFILAHLSRHIRTVKSKQWEKQLVTSHPYSGNRKEYLFTWRLLFLLYKTRSPEPKRWSHPRLRWLFPYLLTKSPIGTSRSPSLKVILDSVKSAIGTIHHSI